MLIAGSVSNGLSLMFRHLPQRGFASKTEPSAAVSPAAVILACTRRRGAVLALAIATAAPSSVAASSTGGRRCGRRRRGWGWIAPAVARGRCGGWVECAGARLAVRRRQVAPACTIVAAVSTVGPEPAAAATSRRWRWRWRSATTPDVVAHPLPRLREFGHGPASGAASSGIQCSILFTGLVVDTPVCARDRKRIEEIEPFLCTSQVQEVKASTPFGAEDGATSVQGTR